MILISGARYSRGTGNRRWPVSTFPEDKLKVSSFLLAGSELGRRGAHWHRAGHQRYGKTAAGSATSGIPARTPRCARPASRWSPLRDLNWARAAAAGTSWPAVERTRRCRRGGRKASPG